MSTKSVAEKLLIKPATNVWSTGLAGRRLVRDALPPRQGGRGALQGRGEVMNIVQSKDGTTIAFDRLGQGPPLIVVGGAFSYRRWKGLVQLAELLAERFTVIN